MLVNVTLVSYAFVMQLFKWSVFGIDFFLARAQSLAVLQSHTEFLLSEVQSSCMFRDAMGVHRKRQINLLLLLSFPE